MPNITVQVSDELYQHARLSAARRNMTVSALIRGLLLTLPQRAEDLVPEGKSFADQFKTMPEFEIQREADELAIAQYYKNLQLRQNAEY